MTRFDAARLIAINAVVSLAMVAGASLWMQHNQKLTFGTLDVAELYRLKESQVAAVLVKRDSGDAERILAIQRAATFGWRGLPFGPFASRSAVTLAGHSPLKDSAS